MPAISLCMIVRDEQDFIADCLKSVQGLVTEMIVVDTGSTDQTRQIAAALGAVVKNFTWCDDFAAARNHALQFAHGDWILMLDADERLHPSGFSPINDALTENDFDCGMMPLYNADALDAGPDDVLLHGRALAPPTNLPRLLRHTTDLCWHGMIHENVGAWVLSGNRLTRDIQAPIIHYGAIPQVRKDRNKDERNFQLLEQYCIKDPTNLRAKTHFLAKLMTRGDLERAGLISDEAWSLVTEIMANRHTPEGLALAKTAVIDCVPLVTNRARLLLVNQQPKAAIDMCDAALSWRLYHPNIYHTRGCCLEQLALTSADDASDQLFKEAANSLEAAITFHNQTFSTEVAPGVTSWSANTRLGAVFLALNEHESALHHFGQAMEQLNEHGLPVEQKTRLETITGLIEAMIRCNYHQEALAAAQKHQNLKCPDIWVLAAEAAERMGDFATCLKMLKRAQARAKRMPFVVGSRGRMLAELFALVNLYRNQMTAGPGPIGILAAILSADPLAKNLQDPHQPDTPRLQRLLGFLKAEGRLEEVKPALEPEIATRFPNLHRALLAVWRETAQTDPRS